MGRLALNVKHTGQESGDKFREIFKFSNFDRFYSRSVNYVCKLFQPRPLYRDFAHGRHWGTSVPRQTHIALPSPNESSWRQH